ncbi:hypothetical protein ACFOTA_05065 [Chitinophaga sp. GCM10012297]|uniref:DUF4890 domain-containing protein n=1 Tax=Chitinophaga chungangae TaxID=2821488 RepID=A0ABS3YA56_9BACT|nr:hypothetical protein [Chitinophaga chungangae]MBO9151565.1 hypothetical protein [Chitinophaga chungangae]
MKKQILFALAFMLAVNVAAFAQQGGGNGQRRTPEERVKMTVERLTTELQLNKEQAVKLDTVFTKFYKDMQKMREEAQAGGGRMDREAFQKLGGERDEKVKTVLTDDQFKKYKEQMEAMRQRGGNRGGGGNN